MIRTLEEIRTERGDVHGFVLLVTGALPADQAEAARICEDLRDRMDMHLSAMERTQEGLELTGLSIRMESAEVYIAAGMPNGTANPLPPRRAKKTIHPEDFRCSVCGGGYIPETIGMYAGKRYIHTCGD